LENEQSEVEQATGVVSTILEKRHYFLIAGYVFNLSDDVKIRPSIMMKAVDGSPISTDISANVFFLDRLSLGAAYRLNDSFSGIISYRITDQFKAGYAHDFTVSELSDYNSGTHEFMLSYDLIVNRDRTLSPRYF
jgi:type IX secretion system PorP/SprF family membrane protein